MRIATWNINGLRARLDFLLLWLRERQPDAVALQELKLEDDRFPHEALEAAGYRAVTFGQKAWNGVAVLGRQTPELVERGLPGQEELGSRLITARVGGVRITGLYCPNGKSVEHDDFPRKLAWFDDLAEHLETTSAPGEPTVVCGDFNICPQGIDSWNEAGRKGKIFHTVEERSRFEKLLGLGLTDLYRRRHPDRQDFSWWDYRMGAFHRGQGLRLDFLLGTDEIVERTREVEIDREFRKKKKGLTPSDHAPVWVELTDPRKQ